jgi:hypothetical protein
MPTPKSERSSPRPQDLGAKPEQPAGWVKRFELFLDNELHRLHFYGLLFGAFVLAVVITLIIALVR